MKNKKSILIVDDDADIRLGYQVFLRAHDYDTFIASDALSALTEADTHKPDLIILDLSLPAVPKSEYTLPMQEPDAISAELRLLPNLEEVTRGTSFLLPNATKLKSGVSASS